MKPRVILYMSAENLNFIIAHNTVSSTMILVIQLILPVRNIVELISP